MIENALKNHFEQRLRQCFSRSESTKLTNAYFQEYLNDFNQDKDFIQEKFSILEKLYQTISRDFVSMQNLSRRYAPGQYSGLLTNLIKELHIANKEIESVVTELCRE